MKRHNGKVIETYTRLNLIKRCYNYEDISKLISDETQPEVFFFISSYRIDLNKSLVFNRELIFYTK